MDHAPESKRKRILLVVVTLCIVLPGGAGFIDKLVQFFRTLASEEGGGFTLVPIMNYLLVAAGFICLLVWAIAQGMFRDIEGPKYTMLDREEELDRIDGQDWSK